MGLPCHGPHTVEWVAFIDNVATKLGQSGPGRDNREQGEASQHKQVESDGSPTLGYGLQSGSLIGLRLR